MSDQSPATSQIGLHPSPSTSQPEAPSPINPLEMHCYLTEGLENAVHRRFIDSRSFSGAVRSQRNALTASNGGQYLVFSPVTEPQFAKIDQLRDRHYRRLRFMYLTEAQTLVVKLMLSSIHELATSEFCRMLWKKAASIEKGLDWDLIGLGGSTYKGKFGIKEANSVFRPRSSRPRRANWPTLVVESGVSEMVERLRVDAKWWLMNSWGEVNIVLVFSINEENKEILIEQWEMALPEDPAGTCSQSENATMLPKCISTFNLTLED